MQNVTSLNELNTHLEEQTQNPGLLVAVNFYAGWSEASQHMSTVFEQLAKKYSNQRFLKVEAEEVEDITEKYEVNRVPTFLLFKGGKEAARVTGLNAPLLSKKVEELTQSAPLTPGKEEDINERLKKLIAHDKVMLFMKGTPDQPQCGFSSQIVNLLYKNGIKFSSFNVLSDERVRRGLPVYSDWPYYPQLYINSELIGGLDIVTEMAKEGELLPLVPDSHRLVK